MRQVELFLVIPAHGLREAGEAMESRGETFWRNRQNGREKLVFLPSMRLSRMHASH